MSTAKQRRDSVGELCSGACGRPPRAGEGGAASDDAVALKGGGARKKRSRRARKRKSASAIAAKKQRTKAQKRTHVGEAPRALLRDGQGAQDQLRLRDALEPPGGAQGAEVEVLAGEVRARRSDGAEESEVCAHKG